MGDSIVTGGNTYHHIKFTQKVFISVGIAPYLIPFFRVIPYVWVSNSAGDNAYYLIIIKKMLNKFSIMIRKKPAD